MDQERQRIQEDLRGLLDGDVRCDDIFVQMYANDASIYEIRPLGVIRPRNVSDVVVAVQYAAEHNYSIHPRGGGSGLAGESLGSGLVLDFSHQMRRIVAIEEDRVRLQPGVVHAQLNRLLRPRGQVFGPDPANTAVSTMGSVMALNSTGSHWLKYGTPRDLVESMQVVLADGTIIRVGYDQVNPVAWDETCPVSASVRAASEPLEKEPRSSEIQSRLAGLLGREAEVIKAHRPASLVHRCGYHVFDIAKDDSIDLARLLVGSEGTLGLITEMTVRLQELPAASGVVLLFFDRLENAAQAALEARQMSAIAIDIMDRRLLTIARELDSRYQRLLPPEAEAMLLIEMEGDSAGEVRTRLDDLVRRIHHQQHLAFATWRASEEAEVQLAWDLTRNVVPRLYRLEGSARALPFVEDVAVPPERLTEFLTGLQNVLKKHEITASLFGHAGHGQLHIRPFLDLANPEHVHQMHNVAADIYHLVLDLEGTISGEHGAGLSRTWFMRDQFGPLYGVLREVKRIFDPENLFNPGRVVADLPQPIHNNLRPVEVAPHMAPMSESLPVEGGYDEEPVNPSKPKITLQMAWSPDELVYMARTCNGCGRCRTLSPDERMCPIYRFAPREEASPRAKANLMRGILTGRLDIDMLASDELKNVADLCVNCHQCRIECPASVDIPRLMVEAKAQYVATNGMRLSDSMTTRLDRVARWSSRLRPFYNWAIGNRQMRWVIEKLFGVAQGRKLPRIARRNFLRTAQRRRLHRPAPHSGRKVVYFVDVYANWYDVQLAEATINVMEHNHVSVFVPGEQLAAGMSAISEGDLDFARQLATRNVALLADAVRQGYQVITTEPAAAMCLTHEYPNLLDSDDARLVADSAVDAGGYLWQMHENGQLELDLQPIPSTVGYHLPCHLRALAQAATGENLIKLIPELVVQQLDHGCSGMAGTYGLKQRNYRNSLRAGWDLISAMRNTNVQAGITECSACKLQMEQGTTKPTLHPIKLLALSYGLMPEIRNLLDSQSSELVVT
jgi:FAD/FMN-containing dehydrogenase/Fe-S oxidoreductase